MNKRKYSIAQVRQALTDAGGIKIVAAKKLDCTRRTLDSYLDSFPSLMAHYNELHEGKLDIAEGKLFSAVQAGEAWAICFFLKTQGKNRGYTERQEVTGANNQPLSFSINVVSLESKILTEQLIKGKNALDNNVDLPTKSESLPSTQAAHLE